MSSEPEWTHRDNKIAEKNEGWWIGQVSKAIHITKAIFLTPDAAMDFIIENVKQGSEFHTKAYVYLTYWKLRGTTPEPEIIIHKMSRSGKSTLLNAVQTQRIIHGPPK